MTTWRVEALARKHDRSDFDCGRDSLNNFLKRHAAQNARKDISRTYVCLPDDSDVVIGYYTLSSGSVSFKALPTDVGRRLPRYPVPTAHLGRLAVAAEFQGRGLGGMLLVDALRRVEALGDQIGICAVTVYALDDEACEFYRAYGFLTLRDDPHHLLLPLATIRKL